jgi:heat shock protein 90kDa beta
VASAASLRRLPPSLLSRGTAARPRRAGICAAAAAAEAPEETFTYQAEVDRLMDMIVNSLYSNREVFLRELVSNASDALDKQRLLALQDATQYSSGTDLEIRVKADPETKTVVIEDTGVGMTREEILSSLGTIARSGTAKFMESMKEKGDANLIGQFGVGFYSAFLVADRVVVQTKSNADERQWVWESTAGAHSYKIREDSAADLPRGTRITLHLKPDAESLGTDAELGRLIKQYSEFIAFPIKLWSVKQEPHQVADPEATTKAQEEENSKAEEEGREPTIVSERTKTEWRPASDWKIQNDNKPLWTRPPKEVSKEEYASFFKATFKEFVDPSAQVHFSVEGTMEFSALLFVPGMAPFDQGGADPSSRSKSIRLYVKRVFISDEFDQDLMPRYLGFIKGVVDSADLPLNVSREILQESRVVRAIRKQLVKKSLDMLAEVAGREDKVGQCNFVHALLFDLILPTFPSFLSCPFIRPHPSYLSLISLMPSALNPTPPTHHLDQAAYESLWENFGRNLKLGVIEDAASRPALAKLLRFASSASGEGLTSLDGYINRKKESQKSIYYLAADSRAAAEAAPYVESLSKKGFEVLYLTEPIDEVAVSNLGEYEGLALVDVSREDLEIEDSAEDKAKLEESAERLRSLTEYMKKVLGDRVEKVVVTSRLTDSPAIVVASKFGWSANMERIMKAQAMGDARTAEYMRGRRIMEVNPDHPVVAVLKAKVDLDSTEVKQQIELLYDAACLTGGFAIEAPKDFAARVYAMMAGSSGGSEAAVPVEVEVV